MFFAAVKSVIGQKARLPTKTVPVESVTSIDGVIWVTPAAGVWGSHEHTMSSDEALGTRAVDEPGTSGGHGTTTSGVLTPVGQLTAAAFVPLAAATTPGGFCTVTGSAALALVPARDHGNGDGHGHRRE